MDFDKLSRKEICHLLGISAPTLWRLVKKGLPYSQKAGSFKLYNYKKVKEWMDRRGYSTD